MRRFLAAVGHQTIHVLDSFLTEYSAINDELDSLNSCLDELENWNDSLVSRMKEFLENMQKSRQQASSMNDTTNEISKEKIEIDK